MTNALVIALTTLALIACVLGIYLVLGDRRDGHLERLATVAAVFGLFMEVWFVLQTGVMW